MLDVCAHKLASIPCRVSCGRGWGEMHFGGRSMSAIPKLISFKFFDGSIHRSIETIHTNQYCELKLNFRKRNIFETLYQQIDFDSYAVKYIRIGKFGFSMQFRKLL